MSGAIHSGLVELTDRGVLCLSGPDTRDFLQGLITNDMAQLSPDRPLYAALLTPQGKFLFDFFLIDFGDSLLLDTRRNRLPDLLKRLTMYKLRADVTIEDVSADYMVGAFIGEAASSLADAIVDENQVAWPLESGMAYIDPRLSAMGFRAVIPVVEKEETLAQLDFDILSEDAYLAHRIAFGMPEGGVDILPDKAFLLESNFDEMHGVDHHKGCYIGQETTSRTKRRGTVRRRILIVETDTGDMPATGTTISAGDADIGTIFSRHANRALATIRTDRWQKAMDAGTALHADGAVVTVHVPEWVHL